MQERFETFTVLIGKINRSIYKIKAGEMAEFDLKSSHVSCLYYLYKATSLTAKALCDACGEDKANISRSIKYLEENDYLVCDETQHKRYQSALRLTEKGRAVGQCVAEKVDNVLKLASDGLSDKDRLIMYKSLNLINENLNKICEKYGD